jgi:hypothetical protein
LICSLKAACAFCSDELTEEASDQGEEFGDERLLSAITDGSPLGLNESVESLTPKVIVWRGEDHLEDDVSIPAIELG